MPQISSFEPEVRPVAGVGGERAEVVDVSRDLSAAEGSRDVGEEDGLWGGDGLRLYIPETEQRTHRDSLCGECSLAIPPIRDV